MTKKNCFVVKTSTNNPCKKLRDMSVFCSSGCHTGKDGFCISNNETCQNYTKKKLLRNISEKDFDKKKKEPVKKIEETINPSVHRFMTQFTNKTMTVEDDVKKPVKKRGKKPVEKKEPVKKIEETINPSVHRFMTQFTNKTMTVEDDVKKPVKKRK
jgi:hypothetical protein